MIASVRDELTHVTESKNHAAGEENNDEAVLLNDRGLALQSEGSYKDAA